MTPDGDNIYNGELSIPIDNDNVVDPFFFNLRDVVVTLNAPTELARATYKLGTETSGRIVVLDDEKPVMKIRAISTNLIEADNVTADFEIYSVASPNKLLPLKFFVTPNSFADLSNFVVNDLGSITKDLDFTNDKTSVVLSIPIINDDLSESNGVVRIDISSGTDYEVGTPSRAQVAVTDDDCGSNYQNR